MTHQQRLLAACLFLSLAEAGCAPAGESPRQDSSRTTLEAESVSAVCPPLLEAPPRGLSCLHCLHPAAREQAQVLIGVLLASNLRNIAVSYLVDESFGYDETALREQIDSMTVCGRQVFIEFYLTNGARQRRGTGHGDGVFGADMSPEQFRNRLMNDSVFQETYRQRVRGYIPVFQHAISRGALLFVVPSLEDNLTDKAFEAMAALTLEALQEPLASQVQIGRNPCPNCYPRNQWGLPEGIFFDFHTLNPAFPVFDGIVSNDGLDYEFEQSAADAARIPSLADVKIVRDQAGIQNDIFFLWTAAYQGVRREGGRLVSPPADMRDYRLPTPQEQTILTAFLRGE